MSKGSSGGNLNIQSTTHGISVDGIQSILNHIKKDINIDLKSNLNNYDFMLETIRASWTGEDANRWCEKFVAVIQETNNSLDAFYEQVEKEFQKIINSWEDFQSSNVKPG